MTDDTGAGAAVRSSGKTQHSAISILNSLPEPVLVVDLDFSVRFVNFAAQHFFDASDAQMTGHKLDHWLPGDNPLFSLIRQAISDGGSVSEYGVTLESPRIGRHDTTITVGPVEAASAGEAAGNTANKTAVVLIHSASIARRIDNQLTHRGAARSVTAMAAMLAHEVKNPLSGIRGAAQLLEATASPEDRSLTRLICDEADRIVALVDRMEVFADGRPVERSAVNIHAVLERVRGVAQNGFGRRVRFIERYDPSLPAVHGNHDQLVQVFLNLVKNACEAAPVKGGEVTLTTSFQHGVSIVVPGTGSRMQLPLVVSVQDNGADGIPDDIRPHLFDPFVTTRTNGTGLGLALVAKIVDDHGGVIELDGTARQTTFRVFLPMYTQRRHRHNGDDERHPAETTALSDEPSRFPEN
ncbi:ATP-binding protein [Fodinicurvata sp. EGI_FJ10296]|uniref:two-component system sensor histidine kinase NtrB n=1 Tax=Fodinicurvata sp. EGI_FJ10296 TaxID=3231908 RepID=UPI0034516AB9